MSRGIEFRHYRIDAGTILPFRSGYAVATGDGLVLQSWQNDEKIWTLPSDAIMGEDSLFQHESHFLDDAIMLSQISPGQRLKRPELTFYKIDFAQKSASKWLSGIRALRTDSDPQILYEQIGMNGTEYYLYNRKSDSKQILFTLAK